MSDATLGPLLRRLAREHEEVEREVARYDEMVRAVDEGRVRTLTDGASLVRERTRLHTLSLAYRRVRAHLNRRALATGLGYGPERDVDSGAEGDRPTHEPHTGEHVGQVLRDVAHPSSHKDVA